ncbi:MAG: cation diffusion facilitator family transporter [Dehalococcoidales bacterium]|jgi:cation diffusion facilitator family transporter
MTEKSRNSNFLHTPEGVSKMAMLTIAILITIKIVGTIVTGSIGMRADAIHSCIDLVGVIIGFFAIKVAVRPSDEEHRYGHGKAENMAGLLIAGLILFAAVSIIYEAVRRLIIGGNIELVGVGIWITIAAIVINLTISWWALRVSKNTESVALEATGRDLYADVLSSVAVLAGLLVVRITGIILLDPIVAIFVGLLIGRTAYLTFKKSLGELMDKALPPEEEEIIKSCMADHSDQVVDFHELRSRKSGNQRFIDLHIVVPRHTDIDKAHQLCDHLENHIYQHLARANLTIHIEPCSRECKKCNIECDIVGT